MSAIYYNSIIAGKFFWWGRRAGAAFGLPIFPSLRDLPEPVDLAVILAPARFIPSLVQDCGELGISRVVVEAAGFSELSEAGRSLEDEVKALLQKYNLRLIGPNGLGCMNMEIGLALPFAQVRPRPRRGQISIIAQSGGVATHLLSWMTREGLGLNKFLSLGNKLDVAENEALAYFLEDPGTAAVYVYLEGVEDGRGLLQAVRRSHQARLPARGQRGPRNRGHRPVPHRLPQHRRAGAGSGLPPERHGAPQGPGGLSLPGQTGGPTPG